MRWLGSLVLVLSVVGCGNNNTGMDMSMADMTAGDMATGDGGGGGGTPCDVKMQNCGAGQKCVLKNVGTAMAPNVTGRCTSDGTGALGATCTRGPGGLGDDDCSAGNQCTSISNATGVFACRKLCKVDGDCAGGENCAAISTDQSAGYCLKKCTTFGTDCAGATNCSLVVPNTGNTMTSNNAFFVCRSVGTVGFYTDCMQDRDCVANAWCLPVANMGLGCQPICSATHACAPQPPGTPDSGANADAGVGVSCFPFDNAGTAGNGLCG